MVHEGPVEGNRTRHGFTGNNKAQGVTCCFVGVADALNPLYRAFANLCTISCLNPTESQGHMLAFLIG